MKALNKWSDLSWALLAGLTALLLAIPVSAAVSPAVVFDSFGPGNTYKTTVAWGVSGASAPSGYRGQAEWFVPSFAGSLSSFTLATYRQSGTGRSSFFIAEDSGFDTPSVVLESFLGKVINPNGLMTLNSSANPMLQAGIKYWLCQEPTDGFTQNGWFQNNQDYRPGFAYERGPWSWSFVEGVYAPPSGVFRVSVIPVPEPSLLGIFLPSAWILIRRFRRAQS